MAVREESIISFLNKMPTDQRDHAGNCWHVIYLPTGFDVADVVIASYLDGVLLTICLVQITRSLNPFKKLPYQNET